MGCSACDVILQAIRRYANGPGSWLSLSDDKPCEIYLAGDCNEPLRVSFKCELTRRVLAPIELFEERRHFQGDYESLYPVIGLGSTPSRILDIDFAARLASQWISRCVQQHGCTEGDEPLLPSRVLDVASGPVRLVIPARSTTGRYAALSYCWGSVGNLTTTSSNLDKRIAGIEWDEIPNLIQDVIRIVRRLEIRYLWVDALCIVQDDAADWRRESSKMGAVYAGAYLTIAADAATDTSCRLTSPRNSDFKRDIDRPKLWSDGEKDPDDITRMRARKRIEVLAPVVVDGLPHSLCVREPWWHWDSNVSASPLNSRGWVLQEQIFSSRVLHFAASEMIWECKASSGPTWSWASTSEEIFWPTWAPQARSPVQILEASTSPMSFNEFGEVSGGKLRLRAPVGVANITNKGDDWITARGDRFHVKPDVESGEETSR